MIFEGSCTGSLLRADGSVMKLYEESENADQRMILMDHKPELCRETDLYAIYVAEVGDQLHLGQIDKEDGSIAYFVQAKAVSVADLDAYEIVGWRHDGYYVTLGITQTIYLDLLLPRLGTLVSDPQVGKRAEYFWVGLQVSAVRRGLRVGVIRADATEVDWMQPGQDYRCWSPPQPHIAADKDLNGIRYVVGDRGRGGGGV
jgi:hypothetical protein